MHINTYTINGRELDLLPATSINRGGDLAKFIVSANDGLAHIGLDVRGTIHTWTDKFDGFFLGRYTLTETPQVVIEIHSASGEPLSLSSFAITNLPDRGPASLSWEGDGTACLRAVVEGDHELELGVALGEVEVTPEQASEGSKKKILIVTKPDVEAPGF